MPNSEESQMDRIERELWKDKVGLSDRAIAKIVGCSHVLVHKTRRERFLQCRRVVTGLDGIKRRLPGRKLIPTSRKNIDAQVAALLESLSRIGHHGGRTTAFLKRKRAQISRAFAKLKLDNG